MLTDGIWACYLWLCTQVALGTATVLTTLTTTELKVVAGDSHNCAISNLGVVKCWGWGSSGILGYDDTDNRGDDDGEMGDQLPSVNFGTDRTAVLVSMGGTHTCALLDDGTLRCWGDNAFGQLGVGHFIDMGSGEGGSEYTVANAEVDIGTGTVVDLQSGYYHNCVLLDDGSVKCWGFNGAGQLGVGDTQTRGGSSSSMGQALQIVDLGEGRYAVSVTCGQHHTCALLDTGEVKCWGWNAYGQLGYEDQTWRGYIPGFLGDQLPAVALGTYTKAELLTSGQNHNCALLNTSELKCWGLNSYGNLGLGDTEFRGYRTSQMGDSLPAIDVLGEALSGEAVVDVWANERHTCVLLTDSSIKCFGGGTFAQLGIGVTAPEGNGPGEMGDALPQVDIAGNAVAVTVGRFHTCAMLDDFSLKCWGSHGSGQLGYGFLGEEIVTWGGSTSDMGENLPTVDLAMTFSSGTTVSSASSSSSTSRTTGSSSSSSSSTSGSTSSSSSTSSTSTSGTSASSISTQTSSSTSSSTTQSTSTASTDTTSSTTSTATSITTLTSTSPTTLSSGSTKSTTSSPSSQSSQSSSTSSVSAPSSPSSQSSSTSSVSAPSSQSSISSSTSMLSTKSSPSSTSTTESSPTTLSSESTPSSTTTTPSTQSSFSSSTTSSSSISTGTTSSSTSLSASSGTSMSSASTTHTSASSSTQTTSTTTSTTSSFSTTSLSSSRTSRSSSSTLSTATSTSATSRTSKSTLSSATTTRSSTSTSSSSSASTKTSPSSATSSSTSSTTTTTTTTTTTSTTTSTSATTTSTSMSSFSSTSTSSSASGASTGSSPTSATSASSTSLSTGTTATTSSSTSTAESAVTNSTALSPSSLTSSSRSSATTASTHSTPSTRTFTSAGTTPSTSSTTSLSSSTSTSVRSTATGPTSSTSSRTSGTTPSSSSASSTSTTTTTTVSFDLVTGSFWFQADNITYDEVVSASKTTVANGLDVEETDVTVRVTLPDSRRLSSHSMPGRQLTSAAIWLVSFSVAVRAWLATALAAALDLLLEDGEAFQNSLLSALEDVTGGSIEGFDFGEFNEPPPEGSIEAVLADVQHEEVGLVETLLGSNATKVNVTIGGVVAVAQRIAPADTDENGTISVEIDENTEVILPASIFEDLGVDEEVVIVAIPLDAAVFNDDSSNATSDGVGSDIASTGTQVQAPISISLFSSEGGAFSVTELQEPITLVFVVEDGSVAECAFYDESDLDWSGLHLTKVSFTETSITCQTTHLTLFAAIVRGFLGAFVCSQASLLSADGIERLGEGDWYSSPTSIALWLVLTFLISLLTFAICLDLWRQRDGHRKWSDAHFLIPEGEVPPDGIDDDLEEVRHLHGYTAIATYLVMCCRSTRDLGVIAGEAFREMLDELMSDFFAFFGQARDICEGAYAGLQGAIGGHGDGNGVVMTICILMARRALRKAAHRNACAHIGVHYEDVYEKAVQDAMQEEAKETGAALRQKFRRSTKHLSQFCATREERLMALHESHFDRVRFENERFTSWAIPFRMTVKQWFAHGAIGSALVFSIYSPSSVRTLLLVCDVLGASAVATFFMSVDGPADKDEVRDECNQPMDFGEVVGRLIAIGVASGFVAALPLAVLSRLHTRKFLRVDFENSPAWRRQLLVWKFEDFLLWFIGLGYAFFCIFYIILFFANVAPKNHGAWIITAGTAFANDLLLAPLAMVLSPPLLAMFLISFIGMVQWKPKADVLLVVQAPGQAEDGNGTALLDEENGARNGHSTGMPEANDNIHDSTEGDMDGNGHQVEDQGQTVVLEMPDLQDAASPSDDELHECTAEPEFSERAMSQAESDQPTVLGEVQGESHMASPNRSRVIPDEEIGEASMNMHTLAAACGEHYAEPLPPEVGDGKPFSAPYDFDLPMEEEEMPVVVMKSQFEPMIVPADEEMPVELNGSSGHLGKMLSQQELMASLSGGGKPKGTVLHC